MKNAQNNTASATPELVQTVTGATGDELVTTANAKPASAPAKTGNIYAEASRKRHLEITAKLQEQQKARQLLAEASDLDREGGDKAAEAAERAGQAGLVLLQSLVSQRMDRDELTSILGEYYGYRLKGDAKTMVPAGHKEASKTPFGRGEEIRKRAFRILKGHEYVTTGGEDRFFAGDEAAKVPPLPAEEVSNIVERTVSGDIGFWNSYERLADLRRAANEGRETNVAYNLRTINSIRSGLAENVNAARDMVTGDPALLASYVALQDVLNIIWQPAKADNAKADGAGDTKEAKAA